MTPVTQAVDRPAIPSLSPPLRLEVGSIVTLRMRGHTRTAGQEYFAPAVVLNQHLPNGEIEALIWDSSAGTHYNPAYQIRDIGVRGDGAEREMYELQSNIGQVLFSPDQFMQMSVELSELIVRFMKVEKAIANLKDSIDKATDRVSASTDAKSSAATSDAKRPDGAKKD